jgi:hypothetical protein
MDNASGVDDPDRIDLRHRFKICQKAVQVGAMLDMIPILTLEALVNPIERHRVNRKCAEIVLVKFAGLNDHPFFSLTLYQAKILPRCNSQQQRRHRQRRGDQPPRWPAQSPPRALLDALRVRVESPVGRTSSGKGRVDAHRLPTRLYRDIGDVGRNGRADAAALFARANLIPIVSRCPPAWREA